MEYDGIERRAPSRDVLMLMDKIQEVAESSARTSENVTLLRADWNVVKPTLATNTDIDRIETRLQKHIEDHTEKRRFTVTTAIALIASGCAVIGSIAVWQQVETVLKSFSKMGRP
jgi:hypothetical protein